MRPGSPGTSNRSTTSGDASQPTIHLDGLRFGVPRSFVTAVRQALPNAGFHAALLRFTGIQLTRNPLNPLPMMRFRNPGP